ncbi:MAG: MBL fold metallo-hydrolase [Candidatus Eiseniibacteriota bacterium]
MADNAADRQDANGGFFARFWGVRGSIPCPGPDFIRYGGNTSCLEVQCSGRMFIFDGGTGLRPLGVHLENKGDPVDADLFFSHTHLDHINGLPFFKSAFKAKNRFRFWAGHLRPRFKLRDVICQLMAEPLFPVPIDIMEADIAFRDFAAGETFRPRPDITIRTAPLNHPNGATGYRIEHLGKSIAYVTDTEHKPGEIDKTIVDLVRDVDVFIYDSTYTDAEYPSYTGWGHSTWQEGARLADAAGAKTFVIFHHDPSHNDDVMDRIAGEAETHRPGTLVAREGMVIRP